MSQRPGTVPGAKNADKESEMSEKLNVSSRLGCFPTTLEPKITTLGLNPMYFRVGGVEALNAPLGQSLAQSSRGKDG